MDRRAVTAATAAIVVSFVAVFVLQVYEGHRRALTGAWDVITVIAQVANDHAFRSFQSIKTTMEQARVLEEHDLPANEINIADATLVREIAILDAAGVVVRSTLPASIGARPLGEADLRRARAQPDTVVFGPVMGGRQFGNAPEEARRSQRHLLPAVMAASNGQFIAVAVNPDYFADVYTPLAARNDYSIALLTLPGVVVAASAGSPLAVGARLPGTPSFTEQVLNQQSGRIGEAGGLSLIHI